MSALIGQIVSREKTGYESLPKFNMADELAWRRNWKPDFETQPWKVVNTTCDRYLIKYYSEEILCSYKIAITDCERVWLEEVNESTFSDRAKKLNPNVEARNSYLLKHLLDSLSQISLVNSFSVKEPVDKNGQLTLCCKSKLPAGISFIWEFYCSLQENHMMREHLIYPLLSMVGELQRRQLELVKLLKKKDYEIEEYKNSGAVLSRKVFETATFEQDAFTKKMTVSEEFVEVVDNCAVKACHEENQELYKQVMIKKKWIGFKNNPISDSEEDGTLGTGSFASQSVAQLPSTSEQPTSSWDAKLPPSLVALTESSPVKRSPVHSPTKNLNKVSSPEKSPSKVSNFVGNDSECLEILLM